MKSLFLFVFLFIAGFSLSAQKSYTKNGNISFFSKAAVENISADNNQVLSTFDSQTGQIQFSVLINAFHFKKSLMEVHFNENYMESGKYPKAIFKGTITDISSGLTKDGTYKVNVTGDLTMHGVTKNISTPATITIRDGIPSANAVFKVKLADYNISIPKIVKENIAETIEIKVSCVYDKKK
jgi:hypothetical protein